MLQRGLENEYNYIALGAPSISVSGIKETDVVKVRVPNPLRIPEVEVGSAVFYADVLINFAHSKGRPSPGYGGAVKIQLQVVQAPNTRLFMIEEATQVITSLEMF